MSVCMSSVVYRIHGGSVILAGQSAVCVCVWKSYIDEPLVGTVILPQIGELPVHLSIGEELLYRIVYASRVSCLSS